MLIKFKNPLSSYFERWLTKRSKVAKEVTLSQKRIYIFLSREGILYGALLLVTFIAGINYANNLVLGLCFYLSSVLVVCIHYTYAQLSGLNIKLLEVAHAQVGGVIKVRLQLSATGSQPHKQLQIACIVPEIQNAENSENVEKKVTATPQTDELNDIYNNKNIVTHKTVASVLEPTIITLYLPAPQRGKFILPRIQIKSVYPLGILRTWTYLSFDASSWIWPKPLAFPQYGQQTATSASDVSMTGMQKGQDEFDKLDNYIIGEPLSRVSWRHLASGKGMLTKHFADPIGHDICLDYNNMPAHHHEAKLSQLSFAIQKLTLSGIAFSIVTPSQNLALNSGESHQNHALLILAKAPISTLSVNSATTKNR